MDEKLFECAVCLEMCHECINCLQCNQLLCKAHVAELPDDRCPFCRDSPFRFQENIALQRIIGDVRLRMGIRPPSPREFGASSADRRAAQAPPDAALAAATLQRWWANQGVAIEAAAAETPARRPRRDGGEVNPTFGARLPRGPGREGQFKKVPSDEHEATMRAHARSCTHGRCDRIWRGPWGTFIGGPDGRTHFDITDCAEGKRLNQLIGWNYENPQR
mmetsp:Transcript_89768/g.253150  ORF Transcript_89768/g.253150 Transcript_89768/m.253150 type:complete len:219 (-) Transcript_89768:250-906(-)|eukprot:CAMPEP_0117583436 /NCGR_PEP_ID=MMETSP0784-20121206/67016_1 /TAXON_ID=39447 /ORGANISM="" /LENGTH=218 /DNA_ID=CAMNT_0005384127 /DNA_START=24 /DNA_END=680 /DNA_ORIENTATION=-